MLGPEDDEVQPGRQTEGILNHGRAGPARPQRLVQGGAGGKGGVSGHNGLRWTIPLQKCKEVANAVDGKRPMLLTTCRGFRSLEFKV